MGTGNSLWVHGRSRECLCSSNLYPLKRSASARALARSLIAVIAVTASACRVVVRDNSYNDPSGPTTDSVIAGSQKLLPKRVSILEETGWLEFVASNVDAVEYYDWPGFSSPNGPAVGFALFENSNRIVQVAVKDRTDEEVVATLVHEAAHLSGVGQIGSQYDEEIAKAVEVKFREDLAAREAEPMPPESGRERPECSVSRGKQPK